jgi:hypothetical protein
VSTPHFAAWASRSGVQTVAKPVPELSSAYPKHGLITMKSTWKMPGGWVIDWRGGGKRRRWVASPTLARRATGSPRSKICRQRWCASLIGRLGPPAEAATRVASDGTMPTGARCGNSGATTAPAGPPGTGRPGISGRHILGGSPSCASRGSSGRSCRPREASSGMPSASRGLYRRPARPSGHWYLSIAR